MKIVKTESVRLEDLVLDESIYPRHQINEVCVNEYCNSLKAGAKFPPIIVDVKSKRTIDGFHRHKAHLKAGLQNIDVEWREYENEKELLWDAINLNSVHGLKLTAFDQTRCIIIGEKAGMTSEELMSALVITKSKFETIKVNRIRQFETSPITAPKSKSTPKFEPVAVKRIIADATEDTVSNEQISGQKSMGCMRALYYIKEAKKILELDLLPINETNVEFVRQLDGVCINWIESHAVNKGA